MKILGCFVVAASLVATAAIAAPPAEYTLTLTPAEVQNVATALSKQPYADVATLIAKMQQQINEQTARAAIIQAPPAPAPAAPAVEEKKPDSPPGAAEKK